MLNELVSGHTTTDTSNYR